MLLKIYYHIALEVSYADAYSRKLSLFAYRATGNDIDAITRYSIVVPLVSFP